MELVRYLSMEKYTEGYLFLADENSAWVAKRLAKFLAQDASPIPDVDLSYLADKVTLTVGFYGTLGNAGLAGLSS